LRSQPSETAVAGVPWGTTGYIPELIMTDAFRAVCVAADLIMLQREVTVANPWNNLGYRLSN